MDAFAASGGNRVDPLSDQENMSPDITAVEAENLRASRRLLPLQIEARRNATATDLLCMIFVRDLPEELIVTFFGWLRDASITPALEYRAADLIWYLVQKSRAVRHWLHYLLGYSPTVTLRCPEDDPIPAEVEDGCLGFHTVDIRVIPRGIRPPTWDLTKLYPNLRILRLNWRPEGLDERLTTQFPFLEYYQCATEEGFQVTTTQRSQRESSKVRRAYNYQRNPLNVKGCVTLLKSLLIESRDALNFSYGFLPEFADGPDDWNKLLAQLERSGESIREGALLIHNVRTDPAERRACYCTLYDVAEPLLRAISNILNAGIPVEVRKGWADQTVTLYYSGQETAASLSNEAFNLLASYLDYPPNFLEAPYRPCKGRQTILVRLNGVLEEKNTSEIPSKVEALYSCVSLPEELTLESVNRLLAWAGEVKEPTHLVLPEDLWRRLLSHHERVELFGGASKLTNIMEKNVIAPFSDLVETIARCNVRFLVCPETPRSPIDLVEAYKLGLALKGRRHMLKVLWTRMAFYGGACRAALQGLATGNYSQEILTHLQSFWEDFPRTDVIPRNVQIKRVKDELTITPDVPAEIAELVTILIPLDKRCPPTMTAADCWRISINKHWLNLHTLSHHLPCASVCSPLEEPID